MILKSRILKMPPHIGKYRLIKETMIQSKTVFSLLRLHRTNHVKNPYLTR